MMRLPAAPGDRNKPRASVGSYEQIQSTHPGEKPGVQTRRVSVAEASTKPREIHTIWLLSIGDGLAGGSLCKFSESVECFSARPVSTAL